MQNTHLFKPSILYVEDDHCIREEIGRFLKRFCDEVYFARNGQEGLEIYLTHQPDIVITDIRMPVMDGIEMLQAIKQDNDKQFAIFTSAYSDTHYLLDAVELQVEGYIFKPIDLHKLKDKIESIVEQIVTKKELQTRLYFDELTGLRNRFSFLEDLKKQDVNEIFLIDINNFHVINEVYGNRLGSEVLVAFAQKLNSLVELGNCQCYRVSGDEFALVNPVKCINESEHKDCIESILAKLDESHYHIEGHHIAIGVTVGIAKEQENSYECAKSALEYAKKHQKLYTQYSSDIDKKDQSSRTLKIKDEIVDAIREKRIQAVYHPITDGSEAVKYEALMRLRGRDGKLIAPWYFLDIALKTRLYPQLSEMIIFQALDKIKQTEHTISINLNYSDTTNFPLLESIETYLLENEGVGERLIFEVLESEHIESYNNIKAFTKRFRKLGVKIAIDDFGSGFSNFEHILELEQDYLKIDGSLVKAIDTDEKSRTLVEAIVSFSHKLGIRVIAEHVHSQEILEILQALNVDEYQGFYFSEPVEDIEEN